MTATGSEKLKVHFVITGLETGGAEMMLFKLLSTIDRSRFSVRVTSLLPGGPVAGMLAAIGVPVSSLGMRRGQPLSLKVVKLVEELRRERPDIVQTWMYHADLVGGLAARLAGKAPVVWNIRNGTLDRQTSKKTTFLTVRACSSLSRRLPERIVCCAESAKRIHAEFGYREERMTVIPNGFDVASFKPDREARKRLRHACGIPPQATVVGLAGRFDPQKDHATFFSALTRLAPQNDALHCVLCGNGVDAHNPALRRLVEASGMGARVHLLGRRDDMPEVTSMFDIGCSASSYGEAFSNTVGEAMACAVPCVVTDVGDSSRVVGETGLSVSPRDPGALATALQRLIDLGSEGRGMLGLLARRRIEEHFSLRQSVARYEQLYLDIHAARRAVAAPA